MNSKQLIKIWSQVLAQELANKTSVQQEAVIIKLQDILAREKNFAFCQQLLTMLKISLKNKRV